MRIIGKILFQQHIIFVEKMQRLQREQKLILFTNKYKSWQLFFILFSKFHLHIKQFQPFQHFQSPHKTVSTVSTFSGCDTGDEWFPDRDEEVEGAAKEAQGRQPSLLSSPRWTWTWTRGTRWTWTRTRGT